MKTSSCKIVYCSICLLMKTLFCVVDKENGEIGDKDDEGKALHRTQSIFIRNLAPNITKQEVEAVSG